MRTFVLKSGPGLLLVAMAASLGYFTLATPKAPAAQPAAAEVTGHIRDCHFCRLPLYGRQAEPSKLGADPYAIDAATAAR